MWTKFYDMSSGGSEKLGACTIWIEAEEYEAVELFEKIFGLDPYNVTCQCCGQDYSVYEEEPDIKPGDWVVCASDIERFRGGNALTYNAQFSRADEC